MKSVIIAVFILALSGCSISRKTPVEKDRYVDNLGKVVNWPLEKNYKDIQFWVSESEMDQLITSALLGDEAAFEKIIPFWVYVINDPSRASTWAAFGTALGYKKSIEAMCAGLKNDDEKTRLMYEKKLKNLRIGAQGLEKLLQTGFDPFLETQR